MVKGQWAGKNVRWGRVCRPSSGGQRTSPFIIVGLLAVLLAGCSFGGSSGGSAELPPHYGRTKACFDALDAAQQFIEGPGVHQRKEFLVQLLDRAFSAGTRGDLAGGQRVVDELVSEEQPADANSTRLIDTFNTSREKCMAAAAEGRSP